MIIRRDQRGLSESVQHAVVFPVLMLITLGIIQTGIWIHAHNVAAQSAAAAVDIARGSYGDTGAARETALRLAASGGLGAVEVQVTQGGGEVRATVAGEAPLLIDFGLGRVSEFAAGPVERVSQP